MTHSGRGARPGRPPKISREAVVEAALTLDRAEMTLTAVARRLGVARNAVAYHVGGREDLLELVVERELVGRLAAVRVPVDDWRAAVVVTTEAIYDALVDEGALALAISRAPRRGILGPAEQLLDSFERAGFPPEAAVRGLVLLAEVTYSSARAAVDAREGDRRPVEEELRRVLEDSPDQFPAFRRGFAGAWDHRAQFTASIDIIVAGLEQSLSAPGRGVAASPAGSG